MRRQAAPDEDVRPGGSTEPAEVRRRMPHAPVGRPYPLPRRGFLPLAITRSTSVTSPGLTWAAWTFSPIDNSTTILEDILRIYRDGLTRPLHFFPEASWVFAQESLIKKVPCDKALLKAHRIWQGSQYSRGESEDAYYQLCFRNTDPLDSEFRRIAEEVFRPLIAHQREIGR